MSQKISSRTELPAADLAALDIEGQVDVSAGTSGSKKMYAAAKALGLSKLTYFSDSGGDDAYVITTGLALTTLTAGFKFTLKPSTSNSGTCTLAVDSAGAITIKKNSSSGLADLNSGDIAAGSILTLVYDGTYFVLQNIVPQSTATELLFYPFVKDTTDPYPTSNSYYTFVTTKLLDVKVIGAEKGKKYKLAYFGKDETSQGCQVIFTEVSGSTHTRLSNLTGEGGATDVKEFSGATGIVTAEIVYASKPNIRFVITVDCTNIASNSFFVLGYNSSDEYYNYHISEDKYIYDYDAEVRAAYNKPAKTIVKRVNTGLSTEALYIASKWDDTRDIIIGFKKCMPNNLMTFNKVWLANNLQKYPRKDPERIASITSEYSATTGIGIIYGYGSDVLLSDTIGPYSIDYFNDPGHTVPNSVVTFGASHQLTYSGTAKNTATTASFEFYADGKVIADNVPVSCDEVQVKVRNSIYNAKNIIDTGAQNHWFYENVLYKVREGNIEVLLEMEMTNTVAFTRYYGMQLLGETWMDTAYYAHSNDNTLRTKRSGGSFLQVDTSTFALYPNCEKAIISKSDKTINIAMLLDRTNGLGDQTLVETDTYVITSPSNTGKTYHHLISDSTHAKTITAGTTKYWHGIYTFFKNTSSVADYAYRYFSFGVRKLAVDFISAASDDILIPESLGIVSTVDRKDATITVNNAIVLPKGISLTASTYGNADLNI